MSGATLDVSALSTVAFGRRTPIWWAIVLLCLIEATTLVIMFASYLYVQASFFVWPPSPRIPLTAGILNVVTLSASCVPMWLAGRAARDRDLKRTRRWMLVTSLISVIAAPLRAWELASLPFTWGENAYTSIVWTTMGMHCVEGAAGILENGLITLLFYMGPIEKKHFEDIDANALFWFFVVLVWLPFAGLFYIDGVLR